MPLNRSDKLLIGVIYRSKSSTEENNDELLKLMEAAVNRNNSSHHLIIGDFNLPNIDWSNVFTHDENSYEQRFIDMIEDIYLIQASTSPSRFRSGDEP